MIIINIRENFIDPHRTYLQVYQVCVTQKNWYFRNLNFLYYYCTVIILVVWQRGGAFFRVLSYNILQTVHTFKYVIHNPQIKHILEHTTHSKGFTLHTNSEYTNQTPPGSQNILQNTKYKEHNTNYALHISNKTLHVVPRQPDYYFASLRPKSACQ